MPSREIPIAQIRIPPERIRKDLGDIEGLTLEIQRYGNAPKVPIIVTDCGNGTYDLVDGQRRIVALQKLGVKFVNAEMLADCDALTKLELEYVIGKERKDFTWQELALAEEKFHKAKVAAYGAAIRGYIGEGTKGWRLADTANVFKRSEAAVSQDIGLAEAMKEYPNLAQEPTRIQALRKLRRIKDGIEIPQDIIDKTKKFIEESYINASFHDFLPRLEREFNLVITDITTETNLPVYAADLMDKMMDMSAGFLFTSLPNPHLQMQEFSRIGFKIKSNPFIFSYRGELLEPTYVIWIAKGEIAEPQLMGMTSLKRDVSAVHHKDVPVAYLLKLMDCYPNFKSLLDTNAYGGAILAAAKTAQRNVKAFTSTKEIYDAGMKRLMNLYMPITRRYDDETMGLTNEGET